MNDIVFNFRKNIYGVFTFYAYLPFSKSKMTEEIIEWCQLQYEDKNWKCSCDTIPYNSNYPNEQFFISFWFKNWTDACLFKLKFITRDIK